MGRAHLVVAMLLAAACGAKAEGVHVATIEINAAGCERTDGIADVVLTRESLAGAPGTALPLGADSIDVVEAARDGSIIDRTTGFQLDRLGDALATLSIRLKGTTRADAPRYFQVRAREAGKTFSPRKVPPLVEVLDDYHHAGQASIRVVTPSAWWYYHKRGAGFASLLDANGRDWISYRPTGGSAGSYRGIPNLVHPEGHLHPGGKRCTSRLVAAGPLKAIVHSESDDGKWACRWEVTDAWARLTVLKAARAYWFLYEGTPGGGLDVAGDFCIRSGGRRTPASEKWTGDLAAPEWVAFGDGKLPRVLFLAHHDDDEHVDSYWPMQGNMTVFGFGRDGIRKYMTKVPAQFTVGFCDSTDPKAIAAAVDAVVRPYELKVTPQRP